MSATIETIAPSLECQEAAGHVWDVAVIGAGPSGALAARELARYGASVLLIDKADFPRGKVCGGCVNAAALEILRTVGLQALPDQLGARPLHELLLVEGQRRVRLALPSGVALSRETFDAALVQEAIKAGASFLPHTTARLESGDTSLPRLMLRCEEQQIHVKTRVILLANGLGGGLGRKGRIGVGTIIEETPQGYCGGTIFMICGSGGYVGLVQLENGQLNVAASFDPAFVRLAKGPGPAAEQLIAQAGLPHINGLSEGVWRGTPRLTQHGLRVAQKRLFVIGDAAGYIEPFTGEGIASAMWCGVAVSPLALEAIREWKPSLADRWDALYRQQVGRRQWACRGLTAILKQPMLIRAAIELLSWRPSLATPLIQYVEAPLPVHFN